MLSAQMKRAGRAVRIGPTPYGLGVFARRRFQPRETIAEIHGGRVAEAGYWSEYCMGLGGGLVLEPRAPLRYLNHSCEPNCELVRTVTAEDRDGVVRRALFLKALVRIVRGRQLTIDYAWSAESAIPCLCGTANCRGWIVADEELHLLEAS